MILFNNLYLKSSSRNTVSDMVYDNKFKLTYKIIYSFKLYSKNKRHTLMCIRYIHDSH